MDSIANFYNSLFAAEITAFGIIAGVILVFLQLMHSQFSYRQVKLVFHGFTFVIVVIASGAILIITGLASILSTLQQHDYFPNIDFHAQRLISNQYTPLILMISFFITILLYIFVITKKLKYLKPANILLFEASRIKTEDIKKYIFRRYGISQPFPKLDIKMDGDKSCMTLVCTDIDSQIQLKYDLVKQSVMNASDPFDSMIPIVTKAFAESDFTSLEAFSKTLTQISITFLNSHHDESGDSDEAHIYDDLMIKYVRYVTDHMRILFERVQSQQLTVGELKLLEVTKQIAGQIVPRKKPYEINELFEFWKEVADASIRRSDETFKAVVNMYGEIAKVIWDQNRDDESLKFIFRDLGWLGERLLGKQGFEDEPLMYNDRATTVFDSLVNLLLSYSHKYQTEYPESYPLIYFDAIYVIFIKLIKLYDEMGYRAKEDVLNCVFVYYSFAKSAILAKNEDGAALAVFKLKQCYDDAISNKVFAIAGDIADLLVRLGGVAASHKELSGKTFLDCRLEDYIILCLKNRIPGFNYHETLNRTIIDVILPGEGDTSSRWDFVKTLGKELQTNFGMNFSVG